VGKHPGQMIIGSKNIEPERAPQGTKLKK